MSQQYSVLITVRLTPQAKRQIDAAAKASKRRLPDWIRLVLEDAANGKKEIVHRA